MIINTEYMDKTWRLDQYDNIILDFSDTLAAYFKSRPICLEQNYDSVIATIAGKAILNMKEIHTLCSCGYPHGALTIARTVYEHLILMLFFESKRNDQDFSQVVNGYFDDFIIKRNKLSIYEAKEFNITQVSEALSAENSLIYQRYGTLKGDYWWTGLTDFGAIKDYVVKHMCDDQKSKFFLGGHLHADYKVACEFIHSNGFGNVIRLDPTINHLVTIDATPEPNGHSIALQFSTECFYGICSIACHYWGIDFQKLENEIVELIEFYSKKRMGEIEMGKAKRAE